MHGKKYIEIMVKNGCKIRTVNGYRHLHAHVDQVQGHWQHKECMNIVRGVRVGTP